MLVVLFLKTGHYSDEAVVEAQKLADTILSLYGFDEQEIVLALHNNGGSYGANSYLPGGSYENVCCRTLLTLLHILCLFAINTFILLVLTYLMNDSSVRRD